MSTISSYLIKVNNELAEVKHSLKEARQHIKSMIISDNVNKVTITKHTETVIDSYEPKVTTILVATDLGFEEGELNEENESN